MREEPLPCSLCRVIPVIVYHPSLKNHRALRCNSCGTTMGFYGAISRAIRAWNRRNLNG